MALQLSESIWELKETAKWARNPIEKKVAIKTLATRGDEALPSLEEILAVTAYDEIKTICEEAIKSVREKKSDEKSSSTTEKSKGSRLADLPP
jgi:hypothetical protein